MKIYYTSKVKDNNFNWIDKRIDISVEGAIESTLEHTYADGTVERLQEQIDNQKKFIAALVQRLYDTDRLSAEFIKEQIDYGFKVEGIGI
jgi:hypothetical protein